MRSDDGHRWVVWETDFTMTFEGHRSLEPNWTEILLFFSFGCLFKFGTYVLEWWTCFPLSYVENWQVDVVFKDMLISDEFYWK